MKNAARKDVDRKLGHVWRRALTKDRRHWTREQAVRDRELRQSLRTLGEKRPTRPKRDLSQINFRSQHWWKGQLKARELTIDEEKAALIYEAFRRRKEVQRAWLQYEDGVGANGWQPFIGLVVSHLPQPWSDLDEVTRRTLLEEMLSPLFLPPRGYSVFPDKTSPAKCRQAAMRVLRAPPASNPALAVAFVKRVRKFMDAGFIVIAVDNKTKQGLRYALQAVERLPRTFRSSEVLDVVVSTQGKKNETTITVADKRKRDGRLVELKVFSFVNICREFEKLDAREIAKSDFVQRLRLC